MEGVRTFKLGDWNLQCGHTIPDAHIAYKTFGDSKSPAIIYPSWYSGAIADNEWLIGEDQVLSPKKYFIIVTALFGNGQSTSPSNSNIKPFPKVTFFDNVRAQHKLVTEHLGVFLEGVKSALLGAKKHSSAGSSKDGLLPEGENYRVWTVEEREVGLKAFGRVYAGWGFSQAFYRERLYESVLGFKGLEDFMKNFWETWALSKGGLDQLGLDFINLLVMLYTWQAGDCSMQEPYNGDFTAAMQAIKAKTLVLPGKTDLYFPPEDSEIEVANMKPGIGKMEAFPSVWGHWAGGPGDSKDDVQWLNGKLREIGL
ncbi:Homoserine O-acetyltransferase [Hyphodiscus hymeniophilus]|uniref:Homoserine O-acetyltransferase n=1 Tax=Hyphodiscus hymeniophilus TaxID=353542 RepID=A0A9P7AUP7_9HELO|nr:Homoserine O-acetyltransferase [Hyphodiscus hymeniophilus]